MREDDLDPVCRKGSRDHVSYRGRSARLAEVAAASGGGTAAARAGAGGALLDDRRTGHRLAAPALIRTEPENLHADSRLSTVIRKSGWVVLFSPGWRPPVFQAGGRVFSRRAGLGVQRDHSLSGEGFGEPVRVALGQDQVGVVQQPEARGFRGSGSLLAGNPDVDRDRGKSGGRVRGIRAGISMQGTGVVRRRGGRL